MIFLYKFKGYSVVQSVFLGNVNKTSNSDSGFRNIKSSVSWACFSEANYENSGLRLVSFNVKHVIMCSESSWIC